MLSRSEGIKYYFYAAANFLAAFGGGMILGKGIGVIDLPFLKGGSILAFFIGSVLGLGLLQFFPKRWSTIIPPLFSALAAFTSLMLLYIFKYYTIDGKLLDNTAIIFFSLLCIRFGFWFYSRVLRASLAAGKQQRIAWVELGYYVGMISGLIIWKFLDIEIGMIAALALDVGLQLGAGLLDLIAKYKINSASKPEMLSATAPTNNSNNLWLWRLAMSVMLLTVGIQVVLFSLAHQVSEWFSSYVLAFYYLGVSIAAFICRKLNLQFEWDFTKSSLIGSAMIISNSAAKIKVNLWFIGLLALIAVILAIASAFNGGSIALLSFIVVSAFFYEIMALSLLDRIGLEEKMFNKQGMVIKTYGLMAIAAAVSLWFLSATKSSFYELALILLVCLTVVILVLRNRNFEEV